MRLLDSQDENISYSLFNGRRTARDWGVARSMTGTVDCWSFPVKGNGFFSQHVGIGTEKTAVERSMAAKLGSIVWAL